MTSGHDIGPSNGENHWRSQDFIVGEGGRGIYGREYPVDISREGQALTSLYKPKSYIGAPPLGKTSARSPGSHNKSK